MSTVELEFLRAPWFLVIGGTSIALLVLVTLRMLVIARLRRLTLRTRFTYDTLLVDALALPATLLSLAAVLLIGQELAHRTGWLSSEFTSLGGNGLKILLILAVILFLDRFASGFIASHSRSSASFRNGGAILQGIARAVVITIGLLIVLGTLGISITPLVASLGITSLAVALALQPTLENFFSGVQLVMDKPIRVGDFIELESGEQGFVEKIGWRSTWIRMLPNNVVIMPNSALATSKLINYYYPEKELSVPVEVGVHYGSDLDHVERVTLEVARETLVSHEWGVDDYKTFVIFHTFDDSSINFTVMLRAREYFNRFWVKSAFIKALHKRYAEEGIVIPFPIRAVNLDQESAR